jgi:hypothetical protein
MDRSKIIAIVTGAIAIVLSVIYLILVQLLDARGEMVPAPQSVLPQERMVAVVGGRWGDEDRGRWGGWGGWGGGEMEKI